MTNPVEILGDLEGKLVVAIDEEYGYREWLWIIEMTPSELEAWWAEKDDINTFWGYSDVSGKCGLQYGWPGRFLQCDEDDTLYKAYLHYSENGEYRAYIDTNECGSREHPDTCLERKSDGKLITHKGATFDR